MTSLFLFFAAAMSLQSSNYAGTYICEPEKMFLSQGKQPRREVALSPTISDVARFQLIVQSNFSAIQVFQDKPEPLFYRSKGRFRQVAEALPKISDQEASQLVLMIALRERRAPRHEGGGISIWLPDDSGKIPFHLQSLQGSTFGYAVVDEKIYVSFEGFCRKQVR